MSLIVNPVKRCFAVGRKTTWKIDSKTNSSFQETPKKRNLERFGQVLDNIWRKLCQLWKEVSACIWITKDGNERLRIYITRSKRLKNVSSIVPDVIIVYFTSLDVTTPDQTVKKRQQHNIRNKTTHLSTSLDFSL